jgi:predicted MFS family arabinose efflux permease
MKMELGEYGMTYLLRLVACLFLCVSLNSFGATIYSFVNSDHNNGQEYLASINPADNQVNIISHTSLGGSTMLLGGLAAVPLPAGIYLFLSGLVGLGLIKKSK